MLMSLSNHRGMIVLIRTGPKARAMPSASVSRPTFAAESGSSFGRGGDRTDARDVDDRPTPFFAAGDISLAGLYLAPIVANVEDKAPEVPDNLASIDGWARRDRDSPSADPSRST